MLDEHQTEAIYHTALILNKTLRVGTPKADEDLKKLLHTHGTFRDIYVATQRGQIRADLFATDLDEKLAELEENPRKRLEEQTPLIKIIATLERAPPFKVLTINDDEYPQQITGTPVIYYRGDLSLVDTPIIAVIGTRQPNPEDLQHATPIIDDLVRKGYTIVSGLAEACDTLGHRRAIELGGRTIAVLGTPLDQSYPAANKQLQEQIAREHLLISQYPIGITTFPGYFAHRNHTTVSLSNAIFVIKATDKVKGKTNGTLHAVKAAKEQGKPIYALPINFTSKWTQEHGAQQPNDIPRP